MVNFPYLCRDAVFPIQPTYTFQAFAMAWPLASLHTFAVFQYKPTLSSLRGLPIQTNAPRQNRTSMRSAAQAIEFLHRRKVGRERLLCQQPTTRAAVYYHQALAHNTIHNKSPAPPKNKIDQYRGALHPSKASSNQDTVHTLPPCRRDRLHPTPYVKPYTLHPAHWQTAPPISIM